MPQIRVSEKVHKKVSKIADANFRGMGDQVAFWAAKSCTHPEEMRQAAEVQLAVVKHGQVGEDHTLSAFYCQACGQLVLAEENPELSRDLDEAVS
jgi:hypothetical protein